MIAWSAIQEGKFNPIAELMINNNDIKKYLKKNEIHKLLDVKNHIGDAPERAKQLVKIIKKKINEK